MTYNQTSFRKGNPYRFQKGRRLGRPRMYDYEEEARKLDEWSLKEDSQSLYEFTFDKKYLAQELSDFAEACPAFKLSLSKAKERIAKNREKALSKGKLHYAAWNRSAGMYDKLLNIHENAEKDKDAARKSSASEQMIINLCDLAKKAQSGELKQT